MTCGKETENKQTCSRRCHALYLNSKRTGENHHFFGKKRSQSENDKVSEGLKKYFKNNISPCKGICRSKETKKKISESCKLAYVKDPELIKRCHNFLEHKITDLESRLIEVIKENKLPFKYVGDGKFWISYKGKNINPDFIAEKPINVVIETFSNYWKVKNHGTIKNYMVQRKEAFHNHGYKIVFFNEKSLSNKDKILYKIGKKLELQEVL
jgi:very-short-patch-repair endonuclease